MASKPQILATFNAGDSIYDVDNFCATMNWLVSWAANLKAEKGLTWVNRDSDHPTLKTNLKAGKGISITEDNGQLTITATKAKEDEGDDKDDKEPEDNPKKPGGGSGDGNNPPQLDPPEPQPGPLSPTTRGPEKPSPKPSSNCNQWSEDIGNDSSDSGMDNAGDDCSSLNGW